MEALVSHWVERYGKDTVSKWIFECWNEPGTDFFVGTDEEFINVFFGYLRASKRIQEKYGVELHIGTPSGASWALLSKIMSAAAKESLILLPLPAFTFTADISVRSPFLNMRLARQDHA